MVYHFPDNYADRFNAYFERLLAQFVTLCGDGFAPTVFRMGTIAVRISMVFSALRMMDNQLTGSFGFECDQQSFYASTLLCKTLLIHGAAIYNYLPHNKAQPVDTHSKSFFYSMLPCNFDREYALGIGNQLEISVSTVDRRLASFLKTGLMEKAGQSGYHKTGK
jgi:hypothetical protein